MPSRPSSIVVPILVLLVAMLSVQAGASLAKQLFPAVGASGATAFRLVFASLIINCVGVALVTTEKQSPQPCPPHHKSNS